MIEWDNFFYLLIISLALLLSLLGLWLAVILPGTDRFSKRFFRYYFIVFMLCCISGLADVILSYYSVPRFVVHLVVFIECLLLSVPLPMLTVYLLHYCRESIRGDRLFYTVIGLWACYVVLLAGASLFNISHYSSTDNYYYRGPLYPLLLLPLIAILLLNLVGVIRRRKQLSFRSFLSFIISILPMTVALFIQMFVDIFPLIDISYVLSALSMYSLILYDQIERDLNNQREIARQQQEIARQRARVTVLQMRPHFIYNTMTSIYYLCEQNPKKAMEMIDNFTNYLRKNFSAIAKDGTIPFKEELEHVKVYLAIMQVRFEDELFVKFDTPHTNFRIPPLTLQPIVENSIKYGVDLESEPLYISVQTNETESGSEIIVIDNGPGFDETGNTADDNREPHIAIDNIRERLSLMCGGTISFSVREEGGTVVRIWIPEN